MEGLKKCAISDRPFIQNTVITLADIVVKYLFFVSNYGYMYDVVSMSKIVHQNLNTISLIFTEMRLDN